jgi:hypothetical protein
MSRNRYTSLEIDSHAAMVINNGISVRFFGPAVRTNCLFSHATMASDICEPHYHIGSVLRTGCLFPHFTKYVCCCRLLPHPYLLYIYRCTTRQCLPRTLLRLPPLAPTRPSLLFWRGLKTSSSRSSRPHRRKRKWD